jgi:hypothetical protein
MGTGLCVAKIISVIRMAPRKDYTGTAIVGVGRIGKVAVAALVLVFSS